jgi:hypothetical protein
LSSAAAQYWRYMRGKSFDGSPHRSTTYLLQNRFREELFESYRQRDRGKLVKLAKGGMFESERVGSCAEKEGCEFVLERLTVVKPRPSPHELSLWHLQ